MGCTAEAGLMLASPPSGRPVQVTVAAGGAVLAGVRSVEFAELGSFLDWRRRRRACCGVSNWPKTAARKLSERTSSVMSGVADRGRRGLGCRAAGSTVSMAMGAIGVRVAVSLVDAGPREALLTPARPKILTPQSQLEPWIETVACAGHERRGKGQW
jgi:hypothetical protein